MSRQQKTPIPVAKKVLPPAVPQEYRHSGSSFGSSTGYASSDDAVFLLTPDIPQKDEQCDFDGKSPLHHHMFTYPVSSNQKPIVYYQQHLHHQQDDQGIDVARSPGRDSPGSSSGSAASGSGSGSGSNSGSASGLGSVAGSRHSTASLDSGRASYHHHHHSSTGGSSTTNSSSSGRGLTAGSGSSNSPRCSLSSCSISSTSETSRIEKMIIQGVPDYEVIQTWLSDLQFEEYSTLFISAGYDMQTICRMTPEDLTAIGIQNPSHRKKLKSEITTLTLPDNLPDYVPDSIEEWLLLLRLEEYEPALRSQGYNSVEEVTQLTWEDLEDIGIVKLGHQKKIMLAIKRVKDINSGKRFSCLVNNNHKLFNEQCHEVLVHATTSANNAHLQLDNCHDTDCGSCQSYQSFNRNWESNCNNNNNNNNNKDIGLTYPLYKQASFRLPSNHFNSSYYSNIIPIKIHGDRGKSLESLDESSSHQNVITHRTFLPQSNGDNNFFYQQPVGLVANPNIWKHQQQQRSFEDSDLTPTSDQSTISNVSFEISANSGATLPRPRGLVKPRQVAKISANKSHVYFDNLKQHQQQQQQFDVFLAKKLAPLPHVSLMQRQNEQITIAEVHHEPQKQHQNVLKSTLPLPAYPSSESLSLMTLESHVNSFHDEDFVDSRLPPPPAPSTPPNGSIYSSNRSWNADEKELITSLLMQHRNNGSDASFKSSSSTESDSLPFANDNAGTIKNRSNQTRPSSAIDFASNPGSANSTLQRHYQKHSQSFQSSSTNLNTSSVAGGGGGGGGVGNNEDSVDVLNDIGNMLANLTDELDAMLEDEKKQHDSN